MQKILHYHFGHVFDLVQIMFFKYLDCGEVRLDISVLIQKIHIVFKIVFEILSCNHVLKY